MAIILQKYITKFNLILPQQFGFQKGKNAIDAISYIVESIYNTLDNKNHKLSVSRPEKDVLYN